MRQKELTPGEVKERASEHARTQRELERLQDAHRHASSALRMKTKTLRDRISQLAEEVDTGLAWISAQAELFEGVTSNGKDPPRARKKGKRVLVEDGSEAWSADQKEIFEGKSKGKRGPKRNGKGNVIPIGKQSAAPIT